MLIFVLGIIMGGIIGGLISAIIIINNFEKICDLSACIRKEPGDRDAHK